MSLMDTDIYEMSERIRGKGIQFDRIRRITGYLTGSLNSWNSAKAAEERDRVKHEYSAKVETIIKPINNYCYTGGNKSDSNK